MGSILQSVDGPRISVRMGSMGSWKWLAPNWPVRTGFARIAISLFGMLDPMILDDLRRIFVSKHAFGARRLPQCCQISTMLWKKAHCREFWCVAISLQRIHGNTTASKFNKFCYVLLKPAPSRPVQFPWAFLHWLCCW